MKLRRMFRAAAPALARGLASATSSTRLLRRGRNEVSWLMWH